MKIVGEICFSEIKASFSDATIIIKVEDTSRLDAAAKLVIEQRITGISRTADKCEPIPFVLDFPATERMADYSLRVHVDMNSTGDVKLGDYVSTINYPVKSHSLSIQPYVIVVHPVQ